MHITVRAVPGSPDLRSERVFDLFVREIAAAVLRGHGIVEYSVQPNHLHLIVEPDEEGGASRADARSVGRRMQFLLSRLTRGINEVTTRRGRLWQDRYHRSDITSPTQMKETLAYVLFNHRRHAEPPNDAPGRSDAAPLALDPCSSAPWFSDWDPQSEPPPSQRRSSPSGLAVPRTWLVRSGWKSEGLLRFDTIPA